MPDRTRLRLTSFTLPRVCTGVTPSPLPSRRLDQDGIRPGASPPAQAVGSRRVRAVVLDDAVGDRAARGAGFGLTVKNTTAPAAGSPRYRTFPETGTSPAGLPHPPAMTAEASANQIVFFIATSFRAIRARLVAVAAAWTRRSSAGDASVRTGHAAIN